MGYADRGDPDGFPVVNAHGGLSCRLETATADEEARRYGIRLIAPDRPGIGLSDPQPGRTAMDWTHDVAELLDHLGADRFAVMGWSMGAQYAAAVGHSLRERVTRVAFIAGAVPLTEPGAFAELPTMDRVCTRLSQHAPMLARAYFRGLWSAARFTPGWYGRLAARELGAADAAVLRYAGYAGFGRTSAEALRRPAGVVEDYRAWMRPWGFAPEDLEVPVDIWAGTDDALVHHDWPYRLAQRVPGSILRLRSGGHFVAPRHYREIFGSLRPA